MFIWSDSITDFVSTPSRITELYPHGAVRVL